MIKKELVFDINERNVLVGNEVDENSTIVFKHTKKGKYIEVSANKDGFLALAKIFYAFSEQLPDESFHLHLDARDVDGKGNLEKGSDNIVVFRLYEKDE